MSLRINPDEVIEVLLADGWHEVFGHFGLDAYEYVDDDDFVQLGGDQCSQVASTGFSFRERAGGDIGPITTVSGPLTSILAVRCSE